MEIAVSDAGEIKVVRIEGRLDTQTSPPGRRRSSVRARRVFSVLGAAPWCATRPHRIRTSSPAVYTRPPGRRSGSRAGG